MPHKTLIIFAALLTSGLHAQPGPRVVNLTSSIDGSQQPYALYVPRNFDAGRQYPLLISLHSEESNHRLNLTQVLGVAGRGATTPDGTRFPTLNDSEFLIASPLARGTLGYQGIPEQDVYDVLADVEHHYPVDPDRVYLTGISMGGGGALWLAATRPDIWAGVAALCPDTMPGTDELAGNLLNVPVRLFHGDIDTIVPVGASRTWQRRLLDLGVPAGYTEFPMVRHNVWDFAYQRGNLLPWLASQKRDQHPARVRFATRSYLYSSAYWLRIDGLTPGTLAQIDARRANNGDVQVVTRNVDGFTLTGIDPAQVTVDGVVFRPKRGTPLSFSKSTSGWRQGMLPLSGKRPGVEGPIVRAVSSRHMYVYGTQGAATAEEVEDRRKQAQEAAAWSTARTRLTLTLPVKADKDVTPADIENADLVLFGTPESNSIIAKMSPDLPMDLRPDAADYGLLYIVPSGNHYALVSSGLSWWTGADDASIPGYPQAPIQFRTLGKFGDYILFRGNINRVVVEGRFDESWQLPPDAVTRLAATGVIRLH